MDLVQDTSFYAFSCPRVACAVSPYKSEPREETMSTRFHPKSLYVTE